MSRDIPELSPLQGREDGLGWQEQMWTDVGWTDVQLQLSLPGGCRRDPVLSRGLLWGYLLIVTLNKNLQSHSLGTEMD